MRAVIQRVSSVQVTINGNVKGKIETGFLILAGFESEDTTEDLDWMARKILSLRVFSDEEGKMNLDIRQMDGRCLVISQFTLHAKTKKGTRPSFIKAAPPEQAIPLYEQFVSLLEEIGEQKVETGEFGADMKVALVNDGPVTIAIDTKNKE